ncbi:MAG: Gldg family protein [Phycisphaeraceae bacterium]|nr:Gldg family protein [Phycisphaeraceae bacterium]
MSKGLVSLIVLAVLAVLFVGVNVLAGAGLRSTRIDLTQGKLYTLAPGSRAIASKLDEPITLTLYYSEKTANELPAPYKAYAARVKEVLREFVSASKGKIRLEVVSPDASPEAEDKAAEAGLMGAETGRPGSDRFYFGLVGRNATDRTETVPFFRPDREQFLEYEITRLVYLLSDPAKKTVGLMTWLPVEGMQANPMTRGQGMPPWQIVRQMREFFDVKSVPSDAAEIPADVQVLMIIHPKAMSEATQYAVDQFVMRGGRVLLFVDPLCVVDVPPGINPMQAMGIPKSSNLPALMEAWGLEMEPQRVAADLGSALQVSAGAHFVAWIGLGPENMDASDPVTGQLKSLNMAAAGVLKAKDGAGSQFTPLVRTSSDAAPMDVQAVETALMERDGPKTLLSQFVSGGKPLAVAARVTGKFKTAFPGGRPAQPPPKEGEAPNPPPAGGTHLSECSEPASIIVVADCDMLSDGFWSQEERIGNMLIGYTKLADNGDLVIGALDNLSGSSDLIGVRARGRSARPFDRVKEIQKQAEQEYQQKEAELQTKLRETEQRITELQRQRPDGSQALLLTPQQQAEIEKYRVQAVETRKELRNVRHQMRKDIEGLGTRLKVLNIALVPALVGCAAIGLSLWRVQRRRVDRRRDEGRPEART